MIQLPDGLVLLADDHAYIVGKAKKDRVERHRSPEPDISHQRRTGCAVRA